MWISGTFSLNPVFICRVFTTGCELNLPTEKEVISGCILARVALDWEKIM